MPAEGNELGQRPTALRLPTQPMRQDARIACVSTQPRRVILRDASEDLQRRFQRHLGPADQFRQRPDAMHPACAAVLDGPVQGPTFDSRTASISRSELPRPSKSRISAG